MMLFVVGSPMVGLALRHGLALTNTPGTIDPDCRGEVQLILLNAGREPLTIRRDYRIAQLAIAPVIKPEWEQVEHPDALGTTRRGPGGFGHTGR